MVGGEGVAIHCHLEVSCDLTTTHQEHIKAAISMKTVHFAIVGCGLMGREFASAAARWAHLPEMTIRPEIVAICDKNAGLFPWYTENFPAIRQTTDDYTAVLANPEVDAVYCAVPHNLGSSG